MLFIDVRGLKSPLALTFEVLHTFTKLFQWFLPCSLVVESKNFDFLIRSIEEQKWTRPSATRVARSIRFYKQYGRVNLENSWKA